ncbi:MAG: hypothetical protein V3W20_11735 [Candidatus Neomarinimicrobiota bacterium]
MKMEEKINRYPAIAADKKFIWNWLNFAEKHPYIYFGGCAIVFGLWFAYLGGYIG